MMTDLASRAMPGGYTDTRGQVRRTLPTMTSPHRAVNIQRLTIGIRRAGRQVQVAHSSRNTNDTSRIHFGVCHPGLNMQCIGTIFVAMATVFVMTDAFDYTLLTPDFLKMLQKLMASEEMKGMQQVEKSDPSKSDVDAQPSVEAEVALASSTTTTDVPTFAPIANTGENYCNKESPETFRSYCQDARMRSGAYVDPWDPYCGFIKCDKDGKASRHYCQTGSWTGFKATVHGRQAMCRSPLKLAEKGRCTRATFNTEMCRKAEWVVDYNNKAVEA